MGNQTTMFRRLTRRSGGALLAALAGLVLLLAAPSPAAAQEGTTTGSIVGQVLNPDGTPATNARVIVTNIERGTTNEVLTNDQGRFVVALLQPGRYRVRAESPPQPAAELPPVQVSVGQRRSVTLELRPVEVEDLGVAVTAEGAAAADAGVVDLVDEEQIESLPTPGRDFTDFIALSGLVSPQPGIGTGGQFSIAGARPSGTNIQIDGADANNSFFGENRGSSRVPFAFSLQSIKEFQVVSNGYDVEYGKYTGGVVNAVTRSGTNEFEGEAFLFWRDASLTANNFNQESPTDFQAFQFGGSVSGPIVEDELHYFVSGDFQQWDQPTFALTPTRSGIPQSTIDEFRNIMTDVYGFSQEEVASNIGQFTETEDQANLFGRLDWSISQDHRASVRVNYQDFENRNDRISPGGTEALTRGGTFNDESLSIVSELNSTFGRNVYNTFRVQYSQEDRPRPGNNDLPSVEIDVETEEGRTESLGYGGAFFGILFANNLEEDKIEITDNLTFNAGDHTIKVGTSNQFTSIFNKFWLNGNGFFTFSSMDAFRNRDPGFYFRLTPSLEDPEPPVADFGVSEWSGYIQDTWRTSDKLRLTFGLRYDYTNFNDPGSPLADPDTREAARRAWTIEQANGRSTFSSDLTQVPDDTDNFGPRVSFNYDVDGDESTVLRGGVGLFYGRMPLVTHGNVLSSTPNPLLSTICIAAATPEFDYRSFQNRENIPTRCEFNGLKGPFFPEDSPNFNPEFGIGITGSPQVSLWDPDTEQPETWKANLALEQQLNDRWRFSVEGLFSRTIHNFGAVDLILRDAQFRTAEGRPVHVDPGQLELFDDGVSGGAMDKTDELDRLFMQTSNGVARSVNLKAEVRGRPTDDLRVGANYTLNYSFDNNSSPCCTSNALMFDTPTFGNPNFVGGAGDDETGSWGPAAFTRRHVFVLNGTWSLPADFQVSAIYRAQSGNPFTPTVLGDVNGDGESENDRAYIPDPDDPQNVLFGDVRETGENAGELIEGSPAEELEQFRQVVANNECLQEAVGSIIERNTCTNPWWHSVDIKVKKTVHTVGDQSFEVIADFFNVLDGLGLDAGEFTFKRNTLLHSEEFVEDENKVRYSVSNFGDEVPVGFKPFQFQAQLGIRYSF